MRNDLKKKKKKKKKRMTATYVNETALGALEIAINREYPSKSQNNDH
jgi:hypothetical protein